MSSSETATLRIKNRLEIDLMKLEAAGVKITFLEDGKDQFTVVLPGPEDTMYQGGLWRLLVLIPENYPHQPPFIKFMDQILHPNVNLQSGAVCFDLLTKSWSPLFDLVTLFCEFLPQLLSDPNIDAPLNPEAAMTLLFEPEDFYDEVRALINRQQPRLSRMGEVNEEGDN